MKRIRFGDDAAHGTTALVAAVADEPLPTLAIGGTASGFIDSVDDYDRYQVEVVAGHSYFAVVRGTGGEPLSDTTIVVGGRFSPEFPGESVDDSARWDDDGGIDRGSAISFAPLDTGIYTISVGGERGDTGGYTLDLIERAPDDVPGTLDSTVPAAINDYTISWLNSGSDVDVYAIEMVAGAHYMFQAAGGADDYSESGGVYWRETDTALTLYDPDGRQIAFNDDIDRWEDESAAIDFTALTGGTYHVAVSVGDTRNNLGTLGSGAYALEVKEVVLADHDVLDAIDRGTRLASNQVTIYFAAAGEVVDGATSLGWTDYQATRMMAALQSWSDVADLHFSITDDPDAATFRLANALVTTNYYRFDIGAPGTANAGDGVLNLRYYETSGLEAHSYTFMRMVEAVGLGLGLTTPYEGEGDAEVLVGVRPTPFSWDGNYTTGAFGLNQVQYTVMASPASNAFWNAASPMALDIATVQRKYGAAEHNGGDTVYALPTASGAYEAIWDSGGRDAIVYDGQEDSHIDLTAATADYSPTGGGVFSYVGVFSARYAIASGVVIEEAQGGRGEDVLIGNPADNRLDGNIGADTLTGGLGDDTYIVDNIRDVIQESAGEGRDRVESSVRFTIGTRSIESLLLTGSRATDGTGGWGDESITGNRADNRLSGEDGADTLIGGDGDDTLVGGRGADEMHGGKGDDLFVVNSASDTVFENSGEGRDTVESAVSFAMRLQAIEVLRLTGSAAINGAGNGLANAITGNAAANRLTGGGGADTLAGGRGDDSLHGGSGRDVLSGGLGADRFVFDTPLGAGNWDRIRDFGTAQGDRLVLDHAVAGTLARGALDADAFAIGTVAGDAEDRILYDSSTGKLYYDPDGTGALGRVLFAQVTPELALSAGAFQVV